MARENYFYSMRTTFLLLVLAGYVSIIYSQGSVSQKLDQALTFYTSFDRGIDADFAVGLKSIFTAPAYDQLEASSKGNQIETVSLNQTKGRFGGALGFGKKTKQVLYYAAEENVDYNAENFSGTISFWLSLNPEQDLEPGYCDPIQITDEGYNDAAFWVDFSDKNPRSFRMGVFGDLSVWNPKNIGPDKNPAFMDRLVVARDRPFGSGIWTHVVIAYEKINSEMAQAFFYVNGKLQGRRNIVEPFTWETSQAKIFLGLNYVGLIDDLAIFSKMLNLEEIHFIYNAAQPISTLLKGD